MKTNAEKLTDFHVALVGEEVTTPTLPPAETLALRQTLIREEYVEVMQELEQLMNGDSQDLAPLMHELADLLYVTYGTFVACGVDADAVFGEVHRANMQKVNGPRRADGKILKPPDFKPANVAAIIKQMQRSAPTNKPHLSRN